MEQTRELTGKVFTWLYVVCETRHPSPEVGGVHWNCLCDCGNSTIVRTSDLLKNKIRSCGCWHNKDIAIHAHNIIDYPQKHGLRNTKAYGRWTQTLQKCYSLSHPNYRFHGEKGHTVCEEWRNSPKKFCEWYENEIKDNEDTEEILCINLKKGRKIFSKENCYIEKKSKTISTRRREISSHIDYTGMIEKKIGHIQVIEEFYVLNKKNYQDLFWLCICDCGEFCLKKSNQLQSGGRLHCGCWIQTYEWSDKYACCLNCKGTIIKHAANGLCYRCFVGIKKDPNYQPNPILDVGNKWSNKYPCCIDCGTTDRKHSAKGLCTKCKQKKNNI